VHLGKSIPIAPRPIGDVGDGFVGRMTAVGALPMEPGAAFRNGGK
jgi:hypothetical protein